MPTQPAARAGAARRPEVTGFYDKATNTISYLVADPATGAAAVIDPVLDFEPKAGRTSTASADRLLEAARGLRLELVLETHVHADHLSAGDLIRARTGARIGIGRGVCAVQATWAGIYNLPAMPTDGSQFDRLFADGDEFALGTLRVKVWHTPGHTPACVSYLVAGADGVEHVFVGDTLFMPDYGTARTDFPGGDAATLYRSLRRLLSLPGGTRLFMCHDYEPDGRAPQWETTVAAQRAANVHVRDGVDEAAFVAFRTARDRTLAAPALLLPSVQVNMQAGRLPAPEANGTRYLKLPLDRI